MRRILEEWESTEKSDIKKRKLTLKDISIEETL